MDIIANLQNIMDDELAAVKYVESEIDAHRDDYKSVVAAIAQLKGNLIMMGVGKSGHIGKKLSATFASTGTPSFFVHATEAMHGDLGMITSDDLVVMISNSGETKECLAPLKPIHRIGAKIVAFTGEEKSSLAEDSDYLVLVKVKREADRFNLAPTNSSTAVLVTGDALALTVSEIKGFSEKDFGMFHPGGSLGKRLLQEGILK
ncbi:arabinose 5-phosphate isomerase [Ligilactobacillus salitolerans]|uniref:Arabinose 5-phosphate isomerase n=1 Tax=Ligilactobacillus salitolerans TaxID=1808352 RepID=A0A401IR68_9LACO|nr:SIS domain-containing protein [Ligilactobacillus salitolerans]GBG94022.1 arabinose 5-phosphate isomerase [Ligilactobacillus salitolerans]